MRDGHRRVGAAQRASGRPRHVASTAPVTRALPPVVAGTCRRAAIGRCRRVERRLGTARLPGGAAVDAATSRPARQSPRAGHRARRSGAPRRRTAARASSAGRRRKPAMRPLRRRATHIARIPARPGRSCRQRVGCCCSASLRPRLIEDADAEAVGDRAAVSGARDSARRSTSEESVMAQRIPDRPRLTFRPMEADDLDRVHRERDAQLRLSVDARCFQRLSEVASRVLGRVAHGELVGHGVLVDRCERRPFAERRACDATNRVRGSGGRSSCTARSRRGTRRHRGVSRGPSVKPGRGGAVRVARIS